MKQSETVTSSSVSFKHKYVRLYMWCYLFVEFLQPCLNPVLIPLPDALDNPFHVYIHASCTHAQIHTRTKKNNHSGHNKIKVTQQ